MPVDSRYKGNRAVKDAGQKPQNAEDKEYVEMIQQQTTFEAAAEGGDFRYSENFQNFDPDKKDYPDLEYNYPPFNPPPFDPWPPGPVPPKDEPPGGDIDTAVFDCKDPAECYCPAVEKCVSPSCTQKIIEASVGTKGTAEVRAGRICINITYANGETSVFIVVSMRHETRDSSGNVVSITRADDTVKAKRCAVTRCCPCSTVNMSYTSTTMAIGTTQELSITGITATCKSWLDDEGQITWTVTDGGSVSPSTGATTTYSAPSDYNECKRPQIKMYCNGVLRQTLTIQLEPASGSGDLAYYEVNCFAIGVNAPILFIYFKDCTGQTICGYWYPFYSGTPTCSTLFSCQGDSSYPCFYYLQRIDNAPPDGGLYCIYGAYAAYVYCSVQYSNPPCISNALVQITDVLVDGDGNPMMANGYYDKRTPTQITDGCCPPALYP